MSEEKIMTRCPSCGSRSLFIGKGGLLTCAVLECKSPSLEATIEGMREEIRLDDELLAERDKVLDALPCPSHGRCVPFALQEIVRLKHPHPTSPRAPIRGDQGLQSPEGGPRPSSPRVPDATDTVVNGPGAAGYRASDRGGIL